MWATRGPGRAHPPRRLRWCGVVVAALLTVPAGCGSGGQEPVGGDSPASSPPVTRSPSGSTSGSTSGSDSGSPSPDAGTPTGQASPSASASPTPSCARRVFAALSPAQRVGQLFVSGVDGTGPKASELRVVRRQHVGGVILMGNVTGGVAAAREVTDRVRANASDGAATPWVATDQEGGQVQRLRGPGFSDIPEAVTQGGWPPDRLRQEARRWGGQLREAGVNLDLAPVMDTVPASLGAGNAPIGAFDREYGHRPGTVARHGAAFLSGMRSAGVTTAAKHFPGLGRVRGNTDTSAGVTDDVTTREDAYLRPFRAAVRAGARMVMVSSARYSRIDPGRLAVFSAAVIRDLLRGELGFTGLVISDDLASAKAVAGVPAGARAVRFLRAGGSVVLAVQATTVPPMVRAVRRRARADESFRDRVRTEAMRVLRAKRSAGLLDCAGKGG